jgi:hypothetical protein
MDFNELVATVMGGEPSGPEITVLSSPDQMVGETDSIFDQFKMFTTEYVQEHDGLNPNSPVIEQIMNSTSLEQIESYLRNLDYCEECFLKLYRRFITVENEDPEGCGCATC